MRSGPMAAVRLRPHNPRYVQGPLGFFALLIPLTVPMKSRRVRGIVDFLKFVDRHMGIDLRGGDTRVPEKHLDEARIGAVLQHVSGAGVAQ